MSQNTGASLLSMAHQLRRESITPASAADEEQEKGHKTKEQHSLFRFGPPEPVRFPSPPSKSPRRLSKHPGLPTGPPASVLPPPLKITHVKVYDRSNPNAPPSPCKSSHSSASSAGSVTPPRTATPPLSASVRAFPLRGGFIHLPPGSPPALSFTSSPRSSIHSQTWSSRPSSPALSTASTPSTSSQRTLRRRYSPPRGLSLREIRKKESEACLKRAYDKQLNAYLDGSIALNMFGMGLDDLAEAVEEDSE